jgi:hypothetical protein
MSAASIAVKRGMLVRAPVDLTDRGGRSDTSTGRAEYVHSRGEASSEHAVECHWRCVSANDAAGRAGIRADAVGAVTPARHRRPVKRYHTGVWCGYAAGCTFQWMSPAPPIIR